MASPIKSILKGGLRLLVFTFCVWWLFRTIDLESLLSGIRRASWGVFAIAVPLSIFRVWLTGLRWRSLHPAHSSELNRWQYFRLSMIAHLFNHFMPGALGGDFAKTVFAVRRSVADKEKTIISVLADRVVGLVSIFLLGSLAFFFSRQQAGIDYWVVAVVFAGFLFMLFVAVHPAFLSLLSKILSRIPALKDPCEKILSHWHGAIGFYTQNSHLMLRAFALCLPIHLTAFAIFFLFSQSLGIPLLFPQLVFIISVMWLVTAIPVSFGGLGVREVSLVWLFSLFAVTPELAVALSALWYANSILVSVFAFPLLLNNNAHTI